MMRTKELDITKLRLKDYIRLDEDDKAICDFALKSGIVANPELMIGKNVFRPRSIWKCSYKEVITLKMAVAENDFVQPLKIIYKIKDDHIENALLVKLFSAYKSITDQLNKILEIEKNNLSSDPTTDEKKAGIEEFEKFGFYNQVRSLTGGDKTKEDYYYNLTYDEVFTELCYQKQLRDFQLNMTPKPKSNEK